MAKGGRKGSSGAAKNASVAAAKLQEDVWAQCDNPNCQKWRRLPPRTIIDENTPWYCYMNPDEEKAACEAPEESYTLDVELEPGYESRATLASMHSAGKGKGSSHADRSSTRSHQQQWQGTQRSHSGSSSQGTKRRADSDALDPPYESKRPRFSTQPAPRSQPQSDASRQNGSAKAEADSGAIPGSDLHGSTSGGLRHSLRPKRPPSYPLKEESPPPQGPSRQSHSGSRQGQGSSRTSSGLSQKAQAAAARPTQKAKKQHKGFEKLLALGGLWEIVKGKGKAITPAPFWVWEGLATHTPAAAELAAQAADVASAARYFEGSNYPSGAAQAAEAASLKRQAMAAAAVIGLDATSQIPDVIAPAPTRSTPSAAAAAVAVKPQQAAEQSHTHSQPLSQVHRPPQVLPQAAGQSAELPSTQLPTHGKSQSLSHILAQTQPLPQLLPQSAPQSQPQLQAHPQPQLSSPQLHLNPQLESHAHSQLNPQLHSQLLPPVLTQTQLQSSQQQQPAPVVQQQQLQAQQQPAQLQPQASRQQLPHLPQHSLALQPHLQQILAHQSAAATAAAQPQLQQQDRNSQLLSHHQQSQTAPDSGAELADWHQVHQQGQIQSGPAVSSQHALQPAGVAQTALQPQMQAHFLQAQGMPMQGQPQQTEAGDETAELDPHSMQSCNGMQAVPLHKAQFSGLHPQNGKSQHAAIESGQFREERPPDGDVSYQGAVHAPHNGLLTDRL